MPRWPPGFSRIPDEPWTSAPLGSLAKGYDAVAKHGWYANLEPTVDDLARRMRPGDLVIDYSGGTGILEERLLAAGAARGDVGIVDVDSSPKFLRLALEKFRDDERVAFRLLRYLKEEKRLQRLDEVLGDAFLARGADGLVSTNAVHLYYDLEDTLRSWKRALRPGAWVHVQSGNVRSDDPSDAWIIDDTVEELHRAAMGIVREDARFARHRAVLDDALRMQAHDALRRKFFLPPRPLAHYVGALERAGFDVERVWRHRVRARTDEWLEFLAVYAEGIIGWVGGSERVEGRPPAPDDLDDRQRLLALAMDRVFGGATAFDATWTYLVARA